MTTTLSTYQSRFHRFIQNHLPHNPHQLGNVYEALHYSFSAGGKRLRPALAYALADSLSIPLKKVDAIAVAVEAIHTYSLIHDDLPAMDDDDFRRGKPACHKQFDEATAILAGDALNTFAFEILAQHRDGTPSQKRLQQLLILAQNAGVDGMVGGQDIDLWCEKKGSSIDLSTLTELHQKKTAKLIEASLIMTYLASEHYTSEKRQLLSEAALGLGLYYQIQDDILDVTQTSEELGKPAGSDIDNNKSTYVSLLGLEGAIREAEKTLNHVTVQCNAFFAPHCRFEDTPLAEIIALITQRKN